MSRAMRGRPPYFSACTAERAPPSSQTPERTLRNASGHSRHRRQGPKCGSGWPQRSHQGGRTGRHRRRHTGQTRSSACAAASSPWHTRHSAGSSSCSRALATEGTIHRRPHDLDRRWLVGEEALPGQRALADEHSATVPGHHARRAAACGPTASHRLHRRDRERPARRAPPRDRSGAGRRGASPSGVALMTTSAVSGGSATRARTPRPRAQRTNSRALPGSRDCTNRSARACAAASATARAEPPVPRTSQRPSGKPSVPELRGDGGHVGVVADQDSLLHPERIAGPRLRAQLRFTRDGPFRRLLVRDGDVAGDAHPGKRVECIGERCRRDPQRDVHPVHAQGGERRVVHDGRQRMGDGIAQHGEQPRATADPHAGLRPRAGRPPPRSASRARHRVSRYTSRSPPNGSPTSASSPSRPAYSPSTNTRPSPPSSCTRAR